MPEVSEELFARLQSLAASQGWTLDSSETAPPYAPPEPNSASSFVLPPKAPAPRVNTTQPAQLAAPTKPPTPSQNPNPAPGLAQAEVIVVPEPRAPVPLQRRRPNMRPAPQVDAPLPPAGAPPSGAAPLLVLVPPPVDAPVAPSTRTTLPVPLVANPSFVPSRSATPTASSGRAAPASRRGGSRSKSAQYFRPYTQQLSLAEDTVLMAQLQAIRATVGDFTVNFMPQAPSGPTGRGGYKEDLAEWLGITLDESEMLRVIVRAALMRMPGIDMHKYISQQRPQTALVRVYEMVCRVVTQLKIYKNNDYWPLKGYATAVLRASAGNHKTANRDKDGGFTKAKGKAKKALASNPESAPIEQATQSIEETA
ncbi:hypothetical protein FRC07_011853, partial [Ceratobasidium sp. 392]